MLADVVEHIQPQQISESHKEQPQVYIQEKDEEMKQEDLKDKSSLVDSVMVEEEVKAVVDKMAGVEVGHQQ